jgi:hypothetical protein
MDGKAGTKRGNYHDINMREILFPGSLKRGLGVSYMPWMEYLGLGVSCDRCGTRMVGAAAALWYY